MSLFFCKYFCTFSQETSEKMLTSCLNIYEIFFPQFLFWQIFWTIFESVTKERTPNIHMKPVSCERACNLNISAHVNLLGEFI